MDNPLPSTTGRVCQHRASSAAARRVDASVNMRETPPLHRDVMYESGGAKRVLQRILKRKQSPPAKIAVVGAGPAGLSAAFTSPCSAQGHRYGSGAQRGGLLRYALPEYRLPKKIVDKR